MPIWKRGRGQPEQGNEVTAAEGLLRDPADTRAGESPGGTEETLVTGVYLSPNESYLAVVTGYSAVTVYQFDGHQLGPRLGRTSISPLGRAAWSSTGTKLAVARHMVSVLDVPSGTSVDLEPGTAVSFFPDGSQLAIRRPDGLSIWQVDPPARLKVIDLPPGKPNRSISQTITFTLSVSPDGSRAACGTNTCTIQVLDVASGRVVHEFLTHRNTISDLEWLGPDTLATASADQTVRIWDTRDGRELRVIEAEDWMMGICYSAAHDCLLGWTRQAYHVWPGSGDSTLSREDLPARVDWGYRHAAASPRSDLLVRLNRSRTAGIEVSRGWSALPGSAPESVSTYANAKVLLLGDSGVGKSGLALVLAGQAFQPTDSTHARRIYRMPVPELDQDASAQREVLLWDLAGQPGYRIVHQLHLSDGAAALIMFDSRSETAPLAGIGHWARALRQAASESGIPPTFLIGARTDRGAVGVSDERLQEVLTEFGLRGYLATSAKEGWGVAELRAAVLAAIDWTRMPVVTSSALFAAAKSFVLDQKSAGTLLTPMASLLAAFLAAPVTGPAARAVPVAQAGRDLLDTGPGNDHDNERLRGVFEGCIARLESAGLVKRLAFGDLVLLQPELIDVYAGAIVNAARDEPDGLGSMLESRVLDVDFQFPQQERIADRQQEKLLIIATLEELTRHEIVLREVTEDGVQLVFPAAFRRDLPEAAGPHDNSVEFTFEGPVVNIYVTLVVRLARSDRFTRRGAFQSAARFEADAGGTCTVYLTRSDEGRGSLQVGYSGDVADVVRFQFERFVLTHLGRRATPGTVRRVRLYQCPDCGSPFDARQVEAAVSRGRSRLVCPVDETPVALEDSYETLSRAQDAVAREMDASADAARGIAAASSVILGKKETTDFDVFLCHHAVDKPTVRLIARQLRDHGILPWLDEAELTPGRDWQEELERQIGNIRTAAVFVGPSGIGPWQNRELRAFLNEFAERGCPVIPVLLPEAATPELPIFLRGMTWVDLRHQDGDGIERLIWGITGRKPDPSELGKFLE